MRSPNRATGAKEVAGMYEFEIRYLDTDEIDFLYGYSANDLVRRYPHIDPTSYKIERRDYID